MRKIFAEEVILFISLLKWFVLATFTGIIVGLSTTFFLKALDLGISLTSKFPYYYLFLPVALFTSTSLVFYLAPEAEGHGTEKGIEAIHKYSGKINPVVVPIKLIATINNPFPPRRCPLGKEAGQGI